MNNLITALNILGNIIWEVIKWNPGIIVPTIISCILCILFKFHQETRGMLEEIIGLFF